MALLSPDFYAPSKLALSLAVLALDFVELPLDDLLEKGTGCWVNRDRRPFLLDQGLDDVDRHSPHLAVGPVPVMADTEEVCVVGPVPVDGVGDAQSRSATAADHRPLEIVMMSAFLLTVAPAVEDRLDRVEGLQVDELRVFAVVFDALEGHFADVVPVPEHSTRAAAMMTSKAISTNNDQSRPKTSCCVSSVRRLNSMGRP